ncbi:MAG: DUF2254 family protein, partial [Pseudomonadales bacterium]
WINELDSSVSFEIISTSAELLAAILAIAITVVAIVVELAANRYSHRITYLFLRDPINIGVMSFFVVATLYSLWIALTLDSAMDGAAVANAGLLISMIMVTLSLVILLPYFAYVMSFLSPVNIIATIQNSALVAIETLELDSVENSKEKFLNAVDQLQDIARRSVELSDRSVEMASINSLLDLVSKYQDLISSRKHEIPGWFSIDSTIRKDPDFISINNNSLDQIEEQQLWVEVKIMRQYLDLVSDSNPSSRDTTYLIAINTKNIAVSSIQSRPGLELVDLCMRCFNSYLRATINNKDARTGYYIMNQYRMLAEELMASGEDETVVKIARHINFYGTLGFKQNIPFLLEVSAEDIAKLAANCIGSNESLLDKLLYLLLELDQEVKQEFQEESLIGVRRAQLKLAARFLSSNEEARAARICEDIKLEKAERK